jgi:hypothetical protein
MHQEIVECAAIASRRAQPPTLTIPVEMRVGAVEETITVAGDTPVVDVQTAHRETVLNADVVAVIPGNRSVGTLLNAVPGLIVNDGALAASPTMTFVAARGGPIKEGRMTINGMTVAAPFNGGGVSTCIPGFSQRRRGVCGRRRRPTPQPSPNSTKGAL